MTPFERGYADSLRGAEAGDNPFDADAAPHSLKRWLEGWKAAQVRKSERAS